MKQLLSALIFLLATNIFAANQPIAFPEKLTVENTVLLTSKDKPISTPNKLEDTLESNGLELLNWVKITVQETTSFAKTQTPLYVNEYLEWFFVKNVITFVSILFFLILSILVVYYSRPNVDFDNFTPFKIVIFIIGVIFLIISSMATVTEAADAFSNAVKVKVAPRVVLVDAAKEVINPQHNHHKSN